MMNLQMNYKLFLSMAILNFGMTNRPTIFGCYGGVIRDVIMVRSENVL
jgi:uncharacterized membrane protein YeiH